MAKVEICEEGKKENQQKFLRRYEQLCTQNRASHPPAVAPTNERWRLGRSHRFRWAPVPLADTPWGQPGLPRWISNRQAPATRPTPRSNRPNALRFETHASQLISCLRRPHKMRLQQLRAKPPARKRRRTRRTSPRRRSTPAPPTAPTMAQARPSPVLATATGNCRPTRSQIPRW